MTSVLRSVLAHDLSDIRGAHITGTVPVKEDLINAVLNEEIASRRSRIQQVEIRIGDHNRLQVGLNVAVGPFSKWFRPELTVEPQALHRGGPVIVFRIADSHYGAASRILELFARGMLPSGVHLENQRVIIDFGSVPQTAKYRQFFLLLKRLTLATQAGVLFMEFEMRVD